MEKSQKWEEKLWGLQEKVIAIASRAGEQALAWKTKGPNNPGEAEKEKATRTAGYAN